jgi:hypothetical protein
METLTAIVLGLITANWLCEKTFKDKSEFVRKVKK